MAKFSDSKRSTPLTSTTMDFSGAMTKSGQKSVFFGFHLAGPVPASQAGRLRFSTLTQCGPSSLRTRVSSSAP